MAYLNLKDATIYYDSQGDGPDIVFIHGAGGNHGVWWQQVPFFSQWFRVTTMDMRGFGLSMEKKGSPGGVAFTRDLEALIDHLKIDRQSASQPSVQPPRANSATMAMILVISPCPPCGTMAPSPRRAGILSAASSRS